MPDDKVRINADRTAVVDQGYFWRPIDNNTPRGAKLQLIDRRLGVAVYGVYTGTGSWTHWAPLPKFGDSTCTRAEHKPRADFEAWVNNPHKLARRTEPGCTDEYEHPWTVGAWAAWEKWHGRV